MTVQDRSEGENLRPAMVLGSLWMVGVNVVRRGLGIVSTIILARLLPPEDFGLVAMAHVLIAMLQVLTEFGFDVALIQKQNARNAHYNTAWTFNVIFGVSGAAILMALAWPAALFYDDPRVAPIVAALSLSLFLRGFENIGIVDFRKHLRFQREFLLYAAVKGCAFVVTITIALITGNYWALVIGTLTSRVTALVLSYVMHGYRPRFTISKRKELFSFSIWMFLNNLLMFVRTRGADLVVGRILGPFSLGIFTIAQEIASLPSEQLIAPINRATFPGYSKISDQRARLAAAFVNVTSIIALIAFPVSLGIAAVSVQAVPFLLGDRWSDAIPVVEILAIAGVVTALGSNTGAAYIALGRPRIHVILQSCSVAILFPAAFWLLGTSGIVGMAYAYLLANGLPFLANCFIVMKVVDVRPHRLFGAVVRPMFASCCMYLAVRWLQDALPAGIPLGIGLLASVTVGAAVFVVVLLTVWWFTGRPRGAETIALGHARRFPGTRTIADVLLPAV